MLHEDANNPTEACAAWRALAESDAALSREELLEWQRACDRERAEIDVEVAECERLPAASLARFKREEQLAERMRRSIEGIRLRTARLRQICEQQEAALATARAESAAVRARLHKLIAEASQRLSALGVKVPRS